MTATNSDALHDVIWALDSIHDSLQRLEHILALDFVARFGTEHEAEYAKRHLLNEFRAQARAVISGHE